MEKDSYKRAAASYNPDSYDENGEERFGVWPTGESSHAKNDINQRKYHSKPPTSSHSKMARKGAHMAAFHSALNPLDYYHEEEEAKYDNNELRKFADRNQRDYEDDEELKYEDNHYRAEGEDHSGDELHSHEKLSDGSYDDGDFNYGHDSNRDKPRSITQSIPNNNSREFKSNMGTEFSRTPKRDQDANMTLELSPEAAADKIMNDISQEMRRDQQRAKNNRDEESTQSRGEYHTTFSKNPRNRNEQFDTSREIKISDDMKRNLNNVMEENSEGEMDGD